MRLRKILALRFCALGRVEVESSLSDFVDLLGGFGGDGLVSSTFSGMTCSKTGSSSITCS